MVSIAVNIAGKKVAETIEAYFRGEYQQPAWLHGELLPLFTGLFMDTSPIPGKADLNVIGFQAGQPCTPLDALELEKLYSKED